MIQCVELVEYPENKIQIAITNSDVTNIAYE